MTMIVQDSYTSGQFSSLLVPLRRLYDACIAARQRQADRRTALYMRQMPDDVLLKLAVSVAELESFAVTEEKSLVGLSRPQ